MSSHFPFLHSLSPLTSLPELPETPKFNFASSPWSSPCRRPIKRKTKHTEQRNETGSTDHKHRYVQSPHWHISQARRQTTSYRGLSSELDPNRTVLSQDLSAAARLSALKNTGYRLVPFENDGRTTLLLDRAGTCIGLVAPPGLSPEKTSKIGTMLRSLQEVASKVAGQRRGNFKIVSHGIQMGPGSSNPTLRSQLKKEAAASREFFRNLEVRQHLRNVGESFRFHFPKLHRYYWSTLGLASAFVYDGSPPSSQVPFASFTLNVGDKCICGAHIDGSNLACGLCLVSPFGTYDYRKGGHLILHELKLVLEVPPGCFILFPSAIITHENIPIEQNEFRHSVTAFTPGTLFQWTDHGFEPVKLKNHRNGSDKRRLRTKISKAKPPVSGCRVWQSMVRRLPHITSFA